MFALFLWGFAIYGLIMAIMGCATYIWRKRPAGLITHTIILVVENAAIYVEGMLRTLLGAASFVRGDVRFVVINHGSTDETGNIVQRLAKQEEMLEYYENIQEGEGDGVLQHIYKHSPKMITHLDLRKWEHPEEGLAVLMGMIRDFH